eukprot:TRINITY_DN2638_c0_g1_i1.p2 TRINITY_DN2638_c0_g1~~TRINITY_DN2638_c0_g1_i1.p2  ORF type:complete len:53 (+),score=1.26 TRINITY_DN2638_c0_g1_i1:269-427(+)
MWTDGEVIYFREYGLQYYSEATLGRTTRVRTGTGGRLKRKKEKRTDVRSAVV